MDRREVELISAQSRGQQVCITDAYGEWLGWIQAIDNRRVNLCTSSKDLTMNFDIPLNDIQTITFDGPGMSLT